MSDGTAGRDLLVVQIAAGGSVGRRRAGGGWRARPAAASSGQQRPLESRPLESLSVGGMEPWLLERGVDKPWDNSHSAGGRWLQEPGVRSQSAAGTPGLALLGDKARTGVITRRDCARPVRRLLPWAR